MTHRSLTALVSRTFVIFVAFIQSVAVLGQDGGGSTQEWELVRSVSNPYGGPQDLVLIPDYKQRDRQYYLAIADKVCGDRTACMVNFWTDRAHIPSSSAMPVADLAVMVASYERNPRYNEPVLRLACWLYPNREIAEPNKCAYSPGAKVPWKFPSEDSTRKYQ